MPINVCPSPITIRRSVPTLSRFVKIIENKFHIPVTVRFPYSPVANLPQIPNPDRDIISNSPDLLRGSLSHDLTVSHTNVPAPRRSLSPVHVTSPWPVTEPSRTVHSPIPPNYSHSGINRATLTPQAPPPGRDCHVTEQTSLSGPGRLARSLHVPVRSVTGTRFARSGTREGWHVSCM